MLTIKPSQKKKNLFKSATILYTGKHPLDSSNAEKNNEQPYKPR